MREIRFLFVIILCNNFGIFLYIYIQYMYIYLFLFVVYFVIAACACVKMAVLFAPAFRSRRVRSSRPTRLKERIKLRVDLIDKSVCLAK